MCSMCLMGMVAFCTIAMCCVLTLFTLVSSDCSELPCYAKVVAQAMQDIEQFGCDSSHSQGRVPQKCLFIDDECFV